MKKSHTRTVYYEADSSVQVETYLDYLENLNDGSVSIKEGCQLRDVFYEARAEAESARLNDADAEIRPAWQIFSDGKPELLADENTPIIYDTEDEALESYVQTLESRFDCSNCFDSIEELAKSLWDETKLILEDMQTIGDVSDILAHFYSISLD
jgi:hypothetical protein